MCFLFTNILTVRTLCCETKQNSIQFICQWWPNVSHRIKQEIELQAYLNRLIDEDLERNLKLLKERQTNDEENKIVSDDIDMESEDEQLRTEAQATKDKLNNLFAQVSCR